MPGRRPPPTHLKVMAGHPGKRPLNTAAPQPKRGAFRPLRSTFRPLRRPPGSRFRPFVSAVWDATGGLTEAEPAYGGCGVDRGAEPAQVGAGPREAVPPDGEQ